MNALNEKTARLEEIIPLIEEQLGKGLNVRFAPYGVSMRPLLREGKDSVVLAPVTEKLKKYDIALYRRDNGQYILHRVVKVGETYTCIGDNQFTFENGVRHNQAIAVVSGFYRGERYCDINNIGYKLYCRIWYLAFPMRRFLRRCINWLRYHLRCEYEIYRKN